jgi:hypothetical protein
VPVMKHPANPNFTRKNRELLRETDCVQAGHLTIQGSYHSACDSQHPATQYTPSLLESFKNLIPFPDQLNWTCGGNEVGVRGGGGGARHQYTF